MKASVDYIKKLKKDQERKKILEEKCRIQDFQTRKLIAKLQVFLIIALFENWILPLQLMVYIKELNTDIGLIQVVSHSDQ